MGQRCRSLSFRGSHPTQDRETIAALARARESPSAGAKLAAMINNQCEDRQDAVYNNRPQSLSGPPIQIYSPAFVTFIQEMSHSPTTVDSSPMELDSALEFINVSLGFYRDKSNRRAQIDGLRVLGRLLSPELRIDAGL